MSSPPLEVSIRAGYYDYDDSLDAFGVHGIGGVIGVFTTGLFAQSFINPAGNNGLFSGNIIQAKTQMIAILVTALYSFVITVVLLKITDKLVGLHFNEESEVNGLDISQHGESEYSF